MVTSIELQVISKLLTTESGVDIDTLCSYDDSYYSIFKPHIQFILSHYAKHNNIPDIFTFQSEFPDTTIVKVTETLDYLCEELNKNKQHIILLETFNKLKDLGSGDVTEAWEYINNQCDRARNLDSAQPLNIIADADKRSRQILQYGKERRIPTGFDEVDKLLYGGLSTVEELLIIFGRTNTGKSWVGSKIMESAQKHGFPVLYYSPEMQACILATRFDTWRGHFQNSQLHQGKYNEAYYEYLKQLKTEETPAYILEDSDAPDGKVTVPFLDSLVKRLGIKLLVIDGLSYMVDSRGHMSDPDYIRYKNLNIDLFKLSKSRGCAVIEMMQANRETQNNKDDKGEIFPNLFNIEGSDQPARIATQAIAIRQIFDKHVLDLRLEKSRTANNQKPEFSYSWDINTGNMQYIPSSQTDTVNDVITPTVTAPGSVAPTVNPAGIINTTGPSNDIALDNIDEDIEF